MDASGDYKGIHLWITLWKRDRETFSTARPWFEHLVRIPLSHLIGVGLDTEWANLGTNRLESDDSWYNRSWSCDWCEEGGGSQWIRTIWSNAGVDLEIYEVFRASFLKVDAKYISSRLIVLAPHIVGPVGCPASACISLHFQPLQHNHSNTSIALADSTNATFLATWEEELSTMNCDKLGDWAWSMCIWSSPVVGVGMYLTHYIPQLTALADWRFLSA